MKSDDNPLSKAQVAALGALATEAFAWQDKHDLLDLPAEVASDTKANRMKFWRQRVRAQVTGFTELSDCRQRHYRRLKSKLLELAGRAGEAFDTNLREERAAAAHTPAGAALLREMWQIAKVAGFGPGYIKAIISDKWGTSDVNDLSLGQLRGLIGQIRRRADSKLKKIAADKGAEGGLPDAGNIPF
ncbi:MAG: hypothetical protein HS117_19305 [Verrucomicrobiaceae bacterium]|nr:hypothetical protein [Verrucomicrobiaceae bacterium]